MKSGDRVRILRPDNGPGWLSAGALATVNYTLPSYDKIICKLDEPVGAHNSCCLYGFEENEQWERI